MSIGCLAFLGACGDDVYEPLPYEIEIHERDTAFRRVGDEIHLELDFEFDGHGFDLVAPGGCGGRPDCGHLAVEVKQLQGRECPADGDTVNNRVWHSPAVARLDRCQAAGEQTEIRLVLVDDAGAYIRRDQGELEGEPAPDKAFYVMDSVFLPAGWSAPPDLTCDPETADVPTLCACTAAILCEAMYYCHEESVIESWDNADLVAPFSECVANFEEDCLEDASDSSYLPDNFGQCFLDLESSTCAELGDFQSVSEDFPASCDNLRTLDTGLGIAL